MCCSRTDILTGVLKEDQETELSCMGGETDEQN